MRISDLLIQIVFGWPGIIVSIVVSIMGVALKRPNLLAVAGLISVPFAIYVAAATRTLGLLLPFFYFGAAYAIKRDKIRIAWLLIMPMIAVAAVLAYAVLTQ